MCEEQSKQKALGNPQCCRIVGNSWLVVQVGTSPLNLPSPVSRNFALWAEFECVEVIALSYGDALISRSRPEPERSDGQYSRFGSSWVVHDFLY